MRKVIKYVILDIVKNKIVIIYTIFLFLISFGVFSLEDNSTKGLLTLLNLILFIVPLVSIIFSTIYLYNSSEFIELLVSQPLKRRSIWLSLFIGISSSLLLSFLLGCGLPILIFDGSNVGILLSAIGLLLTISFVAISMLTTVYTRDKAKGIGISIFSWLYFAVLFDALVLFLLFQFSDYPLEKPMMVISFFNPIDLSRILLLLKMDVSTLMGYTGAVLKEFFGTTLGTYTSFTVLFLWIVIPLFISLKKFNSKDL